MIFLDFNFPLFSQKCSQVNHHILYVSNLNDNFGKVLWRQFCVRMRSSLVVGWHPLQSWGIKQSVTQLLSQSR